MTAWCARVALAAALLAVGAIPVSSQQAEETPANEGETAPMPVRKGLVKNLETIQTYYDTVRKALGEDAATVSKESAATTERLKQSLDRYRQLTQDGLVPPRTLWPAGPGGRADFGRDPFAITDRLRHVSIQGGLANAFVPSSGGAGVIPAMKLRGLVRQAVKKSRNSAQNGKNTQKEARVAALLEIEGSGVHVVREGDTVGLHEIGRNTVLKVVKVDSLSVIVEVGSLGQLIIVR